MSRVAIYPRVSEANAKFISRKARSLKVSQSQYVDFLINLKRVAEFGKKSHVAKA